MHILPICLSVPSNKSLLENKMGLVCYVIPSATKIPNNAKIQIFLDSAIFWSSQLPLAAPLRVVNLKLTPGNS